MRIYYHILFIICIWRSIASLSLNWWELSIQNLLVMTINSNNYSNVQWIVGQLIFSCMCCILIRLRTIDLTTSVSALGNLHLRISWALQNLVEPYAALWSDDPWFTTQLRYVVLEYNWELLRQRELPIHLLRHVLNIVYSFIVFISIIYLF